MAPRAFTVFVDDEISSCTKPIPRSLKRSLSLPATVPSRSEAGPSSISATEKENLHPLTGSRIGPVNTLGSKRKSSVLVTKLHNPPEAKKLKKQDVVEVVNKKRKLPTSRSQSARELGPKSRKIKPLPRASTATELPKVPEEHKDEGLAWTLSQSEIDSRCYDLTVTPLANISEAYEQSLTPPRESANLKPVSKTSSIKLEPQHNSFTSTDVIASSDTPTNAPIRDPSLPPPILSTPERKRLYASFTFSSPIKPTPALRNPLSASVKISDIQFFS